MKLKSHSIIFAKGIIVFYFWSRDGLDVEDAATKDAVHRDPNAVAAARNGLVITKRCIFL